MKPEVLADAVELAIKAALRPIVHRLKGLEAIASLDDRYRAPLAYAERTIREYVDDHVAMAVAGMNADDVPQAVITQTVTWIGNRNQELVHECRRQIIATFTDQSRASSGSAPAERGHGG